MTRPPGIRLRGRLRFGPGEPYTDLDLDLAPWQWTCLLGPSGIGKTTLLRLIAGLSTGAEFAGDITATDGLPLEGRMAYMAQSDLLAPWLDVTGNVTLGARLRGERPDHDRAAEMIRRVGLNADHAKHPPALSGGMRQRAALARTLMEDRPVALLDEPFSALDAKNRAEMQELAFETLAGRTVLMVTHDPAEAARLGHRIYLMTERGLAQAATPPTAPIRAYDAPETLAAQTALLAALRRPAA